MLEVPRIISPFQKCDTKKYSLNLASAIMPRHALVLSGQVLILILAVVFAGIGNFVDRVVCHLLLKQTDILTDSCVTSVLLF